jgi:hypothetical protein
MFGPGREKSEGGWRKFCKERFHYKYVQKILFGRSKENEMGEARSPHAKMGNACRIENGKMNETSWKMGR